MEAQGHIVNVSSVGGFVVQPTAAVYAATKFAVEQPGDVDVNESVVRPVAAVIKALSDPTPARGRA